MEEDFVPKKFKEDQPHIVSKQQQEIYKKLSKEKLMAEIEISQIRKNENMEKIQHIDSEIEDFFKQKTSESHVLAELNATWASNAKKDEEAVITKWDRKISGLKQVFEKDKASIQAASKEKQTRNATTRANPRPTQSHSPMINQHPINDAMMQAQQTAKNFHNHRFNAPPLLQPMPQFQHLSPPRLSTFRRSPWQQDMFPY